MGLLPAQVKRLLATETTQQKHTTTGEDGNGRATSSVMMSSGESQLEAGTRMPRFLTPKSQTNIGMWNVRSLNDTGRLTQVVAEMKKYQLGILGISEMRWTGSGSMVSEGVSVYYSGGSKHEKGVGILLSQEVTRAMLSWEPINDRIITMRIQSSHTKVTIIQAYAPTNAAQDQDKNEFYEQLQDILDAAPEHDLKIVMGDFNSQIGADNAGWEDTIGTEAIGERTDNGERLLSLCSTNKMKIGGSLFMHKNIHKGTWRSPDGQTVNQIDHFCISRRWATSLQDVRVHR